MTERCPLTRPWIVIAQRPVACPNAPPPVCSGKGPSVLKVLASLPAQGVYTLTVSGSGTGTASFTLTAGYLA